MLTVSLQQKQSLAARGTRCHRHVRHRPMRLKIGLHNAELHTKQTPFYLDTSTTPSASVDSTQKRGSWSPFGELPTVIKVASTLI